MYSQMLRIAQILKVLTENMPLYKNPIGYRIAPLLMEMDWATIHIITLLQNQTGQKEQLKQYISILYRDDEAADPLIRGWVRATLWTGSSNLEEIQRREELYMTLKDELKKLVPYVQSIYGKSEARFIIPPLYRG